MRSRTQRFGSWLAIMAMLWMAFVPLVSQALGGRPSEAWIEICSASGATKWVKTDAGTAGQPQPGAHPLDHCPYCSLHANALGMPPAPLLALPVLAQSEPPPAFLSAPSTLHAWRSAQPRGPPFLG